MDIYWIVQRRYVDYDDYLYEVWFNDDRIEEGAINLPPRPEHFKITGLCFVKREKKVDGPVFIELWHGNDLLSIEDESEALVDSPCQWCPGYDDDPKDYNLRIIEHYRGLIPELDRRLKNE